MSRLGSLPTESQENLDIVKSAKKIVVQELSTRVGWEQLRMESPPRTAPPTLCAACGEHIWQSKSKGKGKKNLSYSSGAKAPW